MTMLVCVGIVLLAALFGFNFGFYRGVRFGVRLAATRIEDIVPGTMQEYARRRGLQCTTK
jgi:hypothetical protein